MSLLVLSAAVIKADGKTTSQELSTLRSFFAKNFGPQAGNEAEEIVKNINANMKSIRYELGTRVRHQLRIIPELKFFVDDSLDYLERIDELLK